jgi:hypothetical protein
MANGVWVITVVRAKETLIEVAAISRTIRRESGGAVAGEPANKIATGAAVARTRRSRTLIDVRTDAVGQRKARSAGARIPRVGRSGCSTCAGAAAGPSHHEGSFVGKSAARTTAAEIGEYHVVVGVLGENVQTHRASNE